MGSRQWLGWKIYGRHFLTPMQRADLNTALLRQTLGRWKKVPELSDLLVKYGRRRTLKRSKQLAADARARAEARATRQRQEAAQRGA